MLRIGAVLALVALALIGLGSWLSKTHGAGSGQARVTTPDNSDYYMKNATVDQFTQQGQLAYRMNVAQTLHFPDDSARLTDIHVHYLKGIKTYWNLQANKARVPAGQRDLYLYDGVVIHHPRQSGAMVKINTAHAWVRPNANRVDSDTRVTATDPGQKITGDGMRANLDTNELNLLNDVHVTYTPQ